MLTPSKADVYWKKRPNRQDHLELRHRYSLKSTLSKVPDTMLNRIALLISTVEKCAPMQIVKQPKQWKASTTKEPKCSSFQTNYDYMIIN